MTSATAFRFPRDHGSRGSGAAVQHSIRSGGRWSQNSDGTLRWKGIIDVYIRNIDELTDLDFLSNARVLAGNLCGDLLRETLQRSIDPSLVKLTGNEALKWRTTVNGSQSAAGGSHTYNLHRAWEDGITDEHSRMEKFYKTGRVNS